MRISYNWLKEFVDIQDQPAAVGSRLTDVGLALEALDVVQDDSVFEFDVATNRPDCLSHLGIAREASVVYNSRLRLPEFDVREGTSDAASVFSISIADPDLCSRYCGRYIAGVRIGPSPDWLKTRLEVLGVRSVNNVADITNYVMLELGQPLHAFDADTLSGHQVIVRRARLDEEITTLDGIGRRINPSTLVIADADRAIAIAGVMGGADTEISTQTTNVLLESAHFNPISIRRTARETGLSTEASYRFERGGDVEMAARAADRAAALIQNLAGGTIYRGALDIYPGPHKSAAVKLRKRRIPAFLGASVDDAIVERILAALGFSITREAEGWSVQAPSHRIDISREEDLLEEVARHHGFDKFPLTLPAWNGFGSALPHETQERRVRSLLAGSGYSEIYTYSFSEEDVERKFRPDVAPVKLQNPMTEDASILRTSLVPGMLKTMLWNLNRGMRHLQFYEMSKIYSAQGERRILILGGAGALRPQSVHDSEREFGFFDLKGDLEEILEAFGESLDVTVQGIPNYYHPGRAARFGDIVVFGEIHPEYTAMFKIRPRVYIAEVEIERLLAHTPHVQVQPVPRFPAIKRDFSLLLGKGTQYVAVRRIIDETGIPEIVRVEPFDRMDAGPVAEDKYSLSISVIYQSPDRTLTDAEVESFDHKILQTLEERLGAQLRK